MQVALYGAALDHLSVLCARKVAVSLCASAVAEFRVHLLAATRRAAAATKHDKSLLSISIFDAATIISFD